MKDPDVRSEVIKWANPFKRHSLQIGCGGRLGWWTPWFVFRTNPNPASKKYGGIKSIEHKYMQTYALKHPRNTHPNRIVIQLLIATANRNCYLLLLGMSTQGLSRFCYPFLWSIFDCPQLTKKHSKYRAEYPPLFFWAIFGCKSTWKSMNTLNEFRINQLHDFR